MEPVKITYIRWSRNTAATSSLHYSKRTTVFSLLGTTVFKTAPLLGDVQAPLAFRRVLEGELGDHAASARLDILVL